MKKMIVIALALLSAVAMQAQSGKALYEKYSSESGVQGFYMSKIMLKLVGHLPDLGAEVNEVDLQSLLTSMDGMYVLSTDRAEVKNALSADVDKMVDGGGYTLLMEAKEDASRVETYVKVEGEYATDVLYLIEGSEDFVYFSFSGKILLSELVEKDDAE